MGSQCLRDALSSLCIFRPFLCLFSLFFSSDVFQDENLDYSGYRSLLSIYPSSWTSSLNLFSSTIRSEVRSLRMSVSVRSRILMNLPSLPFRCSSVFTFLLKHIFQSLLSLSLSIYYHTLLFEGLEAFYEEAKEKVRFLLSCFSTSNKEGVEITYRYST